MQRNSAAREFPPIWEIESWLEDTAEKYGVSMEAAPYYLAIERLVAAQYNRPLSREELRHLEQISSALQDLQHPTAGAEGAVSNTPKQIRPKGSRKKRERDSRRKKPSAGEKVNS